MNSIPDLEFFWVFYQIKKFAIENPLFLEEEGKGCPDTHPYIYKMNLRIITKTHAADLKIAPP